MIPFSALSYTRINEIAEVGCGTAKVKSMFDDHVEFEDLGPGHHACLTYDEIEQAGAPAQPLDFPTPIVDNAKFITARVLDHKTGRIHEVNNILIRMPNNPNEKVGDRAYLVQRKIARSQYGWVRLCVALTKRHTLYDGSGLQTEWKSTDEKVALKASSWSLMYKRRGRHLEDPLKEVACLQYVGNYHPNVLGCLEVLQDEDYLYVVMPYCSGGDLYSKITNGIDGYAASGSRHRDHRAAKVDGKQRPLSNLQHEARVRCWFRQLLQALFHLQKKGVCHRDLCLENILLLDDENLVVTDFGLSLRVPYNDDSNIGAISDVSQGHERRLMKAQGQSGRLTYLAPEIIERDEGFDGFATDLWSVGVILFVCLTGLAPFKWPNPSDMHFSLINKGKLQSLVKAYDIELSGEAVNLLQNMLWRNPRKRLTLAEVMSHPWVSGANEVFKGESNCNKKQGYSKKKKGIFMPSTTPNKPSTQLKSLKHPASKTI